MIRSKFAFNIFVQNIKKTILNQIYEVINYNINYCKLLTVKIIIYLK